jgi:hypothetical protein
MAKDLKYIMLLGGENEAFLAHTVHKTSRMQSIHLNFSTYLPECSTILSLGVFQALGSCGNTISHYLSAM